MFEEGVRGTSVFVKSSLIWSIRRTPFFILEDFWEQCGWLERLISPVGLNEPRWGLDKKVDDTDKESPRLDKGLLLSSCTLNLLLTKTFSETASQLGNGNLSLYHSLSLKMCLEANNRRILPAFRASTPDFWPISDICSPAGFAWRISANLNVIATFKQLGSYP